MKIFRLLALLLLITGLSGCIQFEEVFELKGTNSVMHFKMRLPFEPDQKDKKKQSSFEEVRKEFEKDKNSPIKLIGFKTIAADGYTGVTLDFSIPNFKALKYFYEDFKLMSPPADKKVKEPSQKEKEIQQVLAKSDFSLKKLKNGNLLFTRVFNPVNNPKTEKKKKGEKAEENPLGNPEDTLTDIVSFRFEMISPTEIVRSNAFDQVGNSLRWQTNIGYLLSKPFKMEAEIKSSPELEKMLSE